MKMLAIILGFIASSAMLSKATTPFIQDTVESCQASAELYTELINFMINNFRDEHWTIYKFKSVEQLDLEEDFSPANLHAWLGMVLPLDQKYNSMISRILAELIHRWKLFQKAEEYLDTNTRRELEKTMEAEQGYISKSLREAENSYADCSKGLEPRSDTEVAAGATPSVLEGVVDNCQTFSAQLRLLEGLMNEKFGQRWRNVERTFSSNMVAGLSFEEELSQVMQSNREYIEIVNKLMAGLINLKRLIVDEVKERLSREPQHVDWDVKATSLADDFERCYQGLSASLSPSANLEVTH